MKAVTEFANVTLAQALKKQAALSAEGKTAEEIQQSLGETYKLEGDKLTYFMNALTVAGSNTDGLKRVLVVSLNEGERAPAKATQVEALYYVPEFHVTARPQQPQKSDGKGGRGGRGGGGKGKGKDGGKKESPWGLSPEEKAAKAGKGPVGKAAKPN